MAEPATSRKESMDSCTICSEPIDNVERTDTIGVCNHTGVCSLCTLRMRSLVNDRKCVFCKTDLEHVICVTDSSKQYQDYEIWGNSMGPNYVFDELSAIFFRREDYQGVKELRRYKCKQEGCEKRPSFPNVHLYKQHLKADHQQHLCDLCLQHKYIFIQEQTTYTRKELDKHLRYGDPEHGFKGHPACEFCGNRFYSQNELYDHLVKKHYECHICQKLLNISYRYYNHYDDLENHFREEHYLCEERSCLEKKFVVFGDVIEYKSHMAREHPHVKISRKLDVHFTVGSGNSSRGRRNRQGRSQGGKTENAAGEETERLAGMTLEPAPPRAADTDLEGAHLEVADFPSLSERGGQQGFLTWSHSTVRAPKAQDFPALSQEASAAPAAQRGGSSSRQRAAGAKSASWQQMTTGKSTVALQQHQNDDRWSYPPPPPVAVETYPTLGNASAGSKRGAKAAPQKNNWTSTENAQGGSVQNEEPPKESITQRVKAALGNDESSFAYCKRVSQDFARGELTAEQYYDEIAPMFAAADLRTLLPQLLSLLPNESKRESALAVHESRMALQATGGIESPDATSTAAPRLSRSEGRVGKQKKNTKQPQPSVNAKSAPVAGSWSTALASAGFGESRGRNKAAAKPLAAKIQPNRAQAQPSPFQQSSAPSRPNVDMRDLDEEDYDDYPALGGVGVGTGRPAQEASSKIRVVSAYEAAQMQRPTHSGASAFQQSNGKRLNYRQLKDAEEFPSLRTAAAPAATGPARPPVMGLTARDRWDKEQERLRLKAQKKEEEQKRQQLKQQQQQAKKKAGNDLSRLAMNVK